MTTDTETVARHLQEVLSILEKEGRTELAEKVGEAVAVLKRGVPEPPGGVVTTGEAAAALGVRSVNTIKRWVREGLLQGFRRGGRILVSRASVDRMLLSPALAEERAYEQRLDADFAAFDPGREDVPPTTWPGRRPWPGDVEKAAGRNA